MPLSTLIVPVLLAFTACFAARKRVDVYAALTKGAEEGLAVLLHILPTLIALLSAVYMLRASGATEALGAFLAPALDALGIPAETAPLLFIRPISGSGALAVGSEIMRTHGVDSYIGRVAAVMLGSSETPKRATPFPPPFAPTQRCSSPRHFLCACSSARKKEDCRRAVLFPIPLPFARGRAGRTRPSARRC